MVENRASETVHNNFSIFDPFVVFRCGQKQNSNHQGHQAYEGKPYVAGTSLVELRVLDGYKIWLKRFGDPTCDIAM
jgi:hypothetical protein